MSDATAFLWIELEGFRGFNHRQRIELDASAVIVVGPNGTGKTSFFDGVQWLLLGSLERLERWRVRKNDEHIVNLYRGSDPARVEAELDIRGSRVRLRRQGRYDSGLLEWHGEGGSLHGEEAEIRLARALTSRPGQDVRRLLMSSALLQQDVVREVLEDKPAERYQHLAGLLGLDELSVFESEVKKRADRLTDAGKLARSTLATAEDRTEHLVARVDALEKDLRLADDVQAVRKEIVARLENLKAIRLASPPPTSAVAAFVQSTAQASGQRLADLLHKGRELQQRESTLTAPPPDDIERLEKEAAAAAQSVEEAEREADAAETRLAEATARSSQLTGLALQALDLLGDACPVCGQPIEEHDVRHRLQQRIEGEADEDIGELVEAREQADAQVTRAKAELLRHHEHLAPLASAREQAEQHARETREWNDQAAGFALPEDMALGLVELGAIQAGDLEAIERAVGALRVVWSAAGDLVSVLRSDSGDARLTEARADARRAQEAVTPLREMARLSSEQEEKGRLLQRAATRAVTAVTQRRFKRLLPTVQDIYSRLDPHPSLTTLDFELDVYRQRGIATPIVKDLAGSVDGDPLLVFSSSQANVAALSYFLALGWAAGRDALPFVLLDDPLQSMDDVNALGFADLCRHIRRQRQLVVSTHERRLGSLLQRKLAPRIQGERTRVIEFKAWTPDGPVIDQSEVSPQISEGAQRSIVQAAAA